MKKLTIFIIAAISFAACKDTDNPRSENEHEAITTVSLIFTDPMGVKDTFLFDDPDGDGGNVPLAIDTIKLKKSTVYNVDLLLVNKTKTPPSDVAPTIKNQGTSHEFFYLTQNIDLAIVKKDKDNNGFPLGFISTWTTGVQEATGAVRVKLMHKPLIKGSNDSPNVGHSDIDITFPVFVK